MKLLRISLIVSYLCLCASSIWDLVELIICINSKAYNQFNWLSVWSIVLFMSSTSIILIVIEAFEKKVKNNDVKNNDVKKNK